MAPGGLPSRWYTVPLDELVRPPGTAAFSDDLLAALVIDGMRRASEITTRRGATVVFRGDPAPFQGLLTFDPGWSSNALSLVKLGGIPHIHKRYRIMSGSVHEPEIMRRLHGTGCLPDYAGDYAYVSRDGSRHWLGVVYRYAPGVPIENLLRANLRTLWAALPADGRDAAAVRDHVRQVAPVLSAAGRAIHQLHQSLASHVGIGTAFAVESCAARMRQLLSSVTGDLLADIAHPVFVRAAIADAMTRAGSAVSAMLAGSTMTPPAAGVSHGDLHLAHLICQGVPEGQWTVRAIDVSSHAIDARDPGFPEQSPWQDLVAVARGFESFATHEAAVQAARVLEVPRSAVCQAAVRDAAAPGSAALDDQRRASDVRRRLFGAADVWSRFALGLLLDNYRDGAVRLPEHPVWRLLYLHRLLHELGYNYAHRRAYQVNVDLRYAAVLADHAEPRGRPVTR